jgi:hypothetical protein
MDILRHGAQRNRGTTAIVEGLSFKTGGQYSWQDNIVWSAKAKYLEIRPRWVTHTDGRTHHNYYIHLTLDDISSMIGLLGHAASATDAKLLRDHLSKHVPAIVKLLACATGVAPVPLEEEESGSDS